MPYCPCCETESDEFRPFGVRPRPNAACPCCGSLERHRLLWLFLQEHRLLSGRRRMLHVAPEPALAQHFRRVPGLTYVTGDLFKRERVRFDITALPFLDGCFDAVVCSHVLEHIPDDRQAMRELRRVLAPNGWAMLQSPINGRLEVTFEDPTVTSPEDRFRLFGQHDHVRWYGRDYANRLREGGFAVTVIPYGAQQDEARRKRCALSREDIFFCESTAGFHFGASSSSRSFCSRQAGPGSTLDSSTCDPLTTPPPTCR